MFFLVSKWEAWSDWSACDCGANGVRSDGVAGMRSRNRVCGEITVPSVEVCTGEYSQNVSMHSHKKVGGRFYKYVLF